MITVCTQVYCIPTYTCYTHIAITRRCAITCSVKSEAAVSTNATIPQRWMAIYRPCAQKGGTQLNMHNYNNQQHKLQVEIPSPWKTSWCDGVHVESACSTHEDEDVIWHVSPGHISKHPLSPSATSQWGPRALWVTTTTTPTTPTTTTTTTTFMLAPKRHRSGDPGPYGAGPGGSCPTRRSRGRRTTLLLYCD